MLEGIERKTVGQEWAFLLIVDAVSIQCGLLTR